MSNVFTSTDGRTIVLGDTDTITLIDRDGSSQVAKNVFWQADLKARAETIHIAVFEPNEGSYRTGGFEWSLDKETAEKAFRDFRGEGGTAYLFTDVILPQDVTGGEAITEWVDTIYWDMLPQLWPDHFGKPVEVYPRS